MWLGLAPCLAALLAAALSAALIPWLRRHALAEPNARSSHDLPTPQGGGIAVIAAMLATVALAAAFQPVGMATAAALGAAVLLAVVGAADDRHALAVPPRLVLQAVAVTAAVGALPADHALLPFAPWWLERTLLVLAGLWFVNLVNFMDGLDWMTVAEMVPVTAALAMLGAFGMIGPEPALVAAALCGAMLGFAPFNRPVAKLFLGDVGSLPIGLLVGWCLLDLARHGHLAAALLLPLYYLADATLTLLRRMTRGEAPWRAHRAHFYQRATDNGFAVMQIAIMVFALNGVLAALAALTIWLPGPVTAAAALAAGGGAVTALLTLFARPRRLSRPGPA
ncbi:MAG: glycosyl transferase [Xanthobacteraceae bacterium]|nr:MAG: glycosyl transferase [Xanthobacteraceae bacterium]